MTTFLFWTHDSKLSFSLICGWFIYNHTDFHVNEFYCDFSLVCVLRSYNINKLAEQAVEEVLKIGVCKTFCFEIITQLVLLTSYTSLQENLKQVLMFLFIVISLKKVSCLCFCNHCCTFKLSFVTVLSMFVCSHRRVQRLFGVQPRWQAFILQRKGAHRQQSILQQSAEGLR